MSLHNWTNKKIIIEDTSSYMTNQDHDIVEEARGKKIADPLRAKLMGMEDIRALKGTMTPRYFATKVIRYLQKENPELDISDLPDEDIQQAINVVAQVSKPLAQKPEVKITTRERGAAESELKRGDTGFETLKLNLDDDAVLKFESEVGENDLYTVVKNGLKYRVTLNKFKGQKLNLDDISQEDIFSVFVVKPSEMETVDKFAGEIDLGQREKLVADYPEGEEETIDMDDVIDAVRKGASKEGDLEDYELEDRRMRMDFPLDRDEVGAEDAESCPYSDEEIDAEKADLDDDGEVSEYERKRGEAIAKAMQKSGEEEEEGTGKIPSDLRSKRLNWIDNVAWTYKDRKVSLDYIKDQILKGRLFKDYKKLTPDEEWYLDRAMQRSGEKSGEEDEEVAMSPQAIQQHLINQYRQKMQNQYSHERRNRYGY